jgi:hypothetical protein
MKSRVHMKGEVDEREVTDPLGGGVDVCHKLEVGKHPRTYRRIIEWNR